MKNELEYRIYYEPDTGRIKGLAHENYPDWGEYIIVNKHQYENYHNCYVKEGKLQQIVMDTGYNNVLKKNTNGFKVVKGHANLLITSDDEYTDVEYYDYK